jgi:hypothetical protein
VLHKQNGYKLPNILLRKAGQFWSNVCMCWPAAPPAVGVKTGGRVVGTRPLMLHTIQLKGAADDQNVTLDKSG